MTEPTTQLFGALADPTRRAVLDHVARGPTTSTRVAEGVGVSRQAVAKHLAILEQAGLVIGEKRGRERVFTVNAGPLETAARYLVRLGAQWDQRLAALRDLVDDDQDS